MGNTKKIILLTLTFILVLIIGTIFRWIVGIESSDYLVMLVTTMVFLDITKEDKPKWEG